MRSKLALPATLALIPIAMLVLASCQQAGASAGSVDLAPGTITYTGSSVAWGSTIDVSLPITNLGSGLAATNFDVKFYATTSSTFNPSSDGPPVGTITVAGIGGSTTVTKSATLTMPAGTTYEDVYIYADVDPANATGDTNTSNNISTASQAGIVLAYYNTGSPPYNYPLVVETYGTTGGSSNPGISLFQLTGGGTQLTWVKAAITNQSNNTYNSIDLTASGSQLPSGTYYLAVFPLIQSGPYALNVRSSNVTSPTFTALTADPSGATNIVATGGATEVNGSNYTSYTTPVPTGAQQIKVGNAQNWYMNGTDLTGTDVTEWFTFTLP